MSFAGKFARGMLSGVAGYYDKVAERQEYDRRVDALQQREMALALVRRQVAEKGAGADSGPPVRQAPAGAGYDGAPIAEDGEGNRVLWNGRSWVPVR
jgi:hypothetical protein